VNPFLRADSGGERYSRFNGGKLDGVGEQIVEHKREGFVIRAGVDGMLGKLDDQGDFLGSGHDCISLRNLFEDSPQVEGRGLDLDSPGGLVGEKLRHERGHEFGGAHDVQDERGVRHRDRVEMPLQDGGVQVDACEMVAEIVGQYPEQFILVLGQVAEVLTRTAQCEMSAHAGEQLGLVEGLGDIVHAAALEGFDDEALVIGGGQEDDRNVFPTRILFDLAAHLDAVHFRHQHIEQNQSGCVRFEKFKRLPAAGGGDDLMADLADQGAEELQVLLLVVNDQDGFADVRL